MPLNWDIKLDTVSISDKIDNFTITEVKKGYVRELTLVPADKDFDALFDFTTLPTPRVEVLTMVNSVWVSQGFFYIEKPGTSIAVDLIGGSVWGRSSTAKLGEPFASKVIKEWDTDTTCHTIINEMALLCGITVIFEIIDYPIIADTYVADNLYPIEVIIELAEFVAGYVGCTREGELIIRPEVFHPSSADYTFTDVDIADMSESTDLPDFGNRIKVSAFGLGSGYTISLEAEGDSDCLAADGSSQGTLLAFVTDSESEPIPDVGVNWTVEDGATLEHDVTVTGSWLLDKEHKALNYYTVQVDYPVDSVVGIWAYADTGHKHNFWEDDYGTIDGSIITVRDPFAFCDQTLKVTYITAGCAVNRIISGIVPKDVTVTADLEGSNDTVVVKMGNPCACGSSLNAKRNPNDAICIGTLAHILIWATINNLPATGTRVKALITSGCGVLSSEDKILKTASISNEASFTNNVITGITQTETLIDIASGTPGVYLKSDTNKNNNLYSSHSKKIIDLNSTYPTGKEVVIDYVADGAVLISWRTLGVTNDCDSEVTITMADGTEEGKSYLVNLSAKDCTIPDAIPNHNDDQSDYDPVSDDQDNDEGFDDDENPWVTTPGEVAVDPCLTTIMGRILNIDTAITEEDRDGIRFGVKSKADCPEDDFECLCSELCDSEIYESGNTYDYSQTLHEQIVETYEEGTPEYNEAFEILRQEHLAECTQKCETNRENACAGCSLISGPEVLVPGESAEYVCSDGTTGLITMPEGACGTQTFTLGCCSFEIRSTIGEWVFIEQVFQAIYGSGGCAHKINSSECSYDTRYTSSSGSDPNKAGTAYQGTDYRICGLPEDKADFDDIYCVQYKSYEGASDLCELAECTTSGHVIYYDLLGYQGRFEWGCI